jgi:stage V sporulation protein D (sporulation-specific penicillin-binding protein)
MPSFKMKKDYIRKIRNIRVVIVSVFIFACLLFLCGRIGYYIHVWGDVYEREAVRQQLLRRSAYEQTTNPNRGFILDRNRQPLAVSMRVYDVVLDVSVLDTLSGGRANHKANTLNSLSEILGIPLSDLEAYFAKDAEGNLIRPTNWQIIARDVSGAPAIQLSELKLRHVYMVTGTQRTYMDPHLAPQTIGFLRGDSAWGLEQFYNTELIGRAGRIFSTFDQDNNPVTDEIQPVNGYMLITTLDSGMQRIAQAAVDKAAAQTPCEYAGIIVMQPYTGEILAMAQWPSFSLAEPGNPDLITDRRLRNQWEYLSEEQRFNELFKVWGNFHTSRTFEPGSIFKPVVVAAALEENLINPHRDSFFCSGESIIHDERIPCWFRYGHGGQDTVEVLAHSCNVAMIEINRKLGRDLFYKYRNDFGFGERTGIDLPAEESVSSPAVMYTRMQLNPVELATSAIGQGFNNTAIQAITAFAAVINGGYVMQPYLVSQIVDEHGNTVDGNAPTIVRKVISGATSNFMREAMHAAVMPGGTAFRRGHIEGYHIGGKTGSGQQGRDREGMTVAYVAYTPVDNPEFIILGVMHNLTDTGLLSGETVVPMVTEAIKGIIEHRNMLPNYGDEMNVPRAIDRSKDVLSNYEGMYFSEVARLLNNQGIDYQVVRSGTIVDFHQPPAGQPIPGHVPVVFYLDADSAVEGEMMYVPLVEGLSMVAGERIVTDAGFVPVSFIDKKEDSADSFDGGPFTGYPTPIDEDGDLPDGPQGVIHQQFPSAGSVIQKGTQVKLKVRLE